MNFVDGYVKDITPRYASKWLTETRKLRVSDDWLEETVNPYRSCDADSHAKEDDDIKGLFYITAEIRDI